MTTTMRTSALRHRAYTMRMQQLFALLVLVATAALAPTAHASVYSGFTVARQFEYIGKFCFTWKPTLEELAGVRLCMRIDAHCV